MGVESYVQKMSNVVAEPESSASRRVFRFGAFEFNVQASELRKRGLRIKLGGQPVSVLAMLLERSGEVITREDLQKRLWPAGTYVDFEHSVNAAIKRLRHALGDSADSPRFIETLPRNGYRFIAPVSEHLDGVKEVTVLQKTDVPQPVAQSKEAAGWRRFRALPAVMASLLLLLALIAAGVAGLQEEWRTHTASGPIRSLAVLPLANLSGDPRPGVFCGGNGRRPSTAPRGHQRSASSLSNLIGVLSRK